jgi:hypothetical protein
MVPITSIFSAIESIPVGSSGKTNVRIAAQVLLEGTSRDGSSIEDLKEFADSPEAIRTHIASDEESLPVHSRIIIANSPMLLLMFLVGLVCLSSDGARH